MWDITLYFGEEFPMLFDKITADPSDPIFDLQQIYKADPRSNKINLSIGVYKSSDLKTHAMRAVKKAEKILIESEPSREYLPIAGDEEFIDLCGHLVFGKHLWEKAEGRISGVQSVGGTSALKIAGEFLKRRACNQIFVTTPTWANHRPVFEKCGMDVLDVPYYDWKHHCLNFEKFYEFLSALKRGSIILLHPSCHNPTGADLSQHQWKVLSELFMTRGLIPFFDLAYQGLGRNLVDDCFAIRLFIEQGHDCFIATTFSKTFGLYCERVGALFVAAHNKKTAENIKSIFKTIIRTTYSNPPAFGARLMKTVLSISSLKTEWELEINEMRDRINAMREGLHKAFMEKSNKEFPYLIDRHGLFICTGAKKKEIEKLVEEHGIYLGLEGRMNLAGLTEQNCKIVAAALLSIEEKHA
jgi:aspartate aminotransferase